MSIRVTFADDASRDAFADRFKIESKVGENQLDIEWNLLQFAKLDDKALNYDDLNSDNTLHQFIIKGDPAKFGHLQNTTIKQDLGNGFYLIETSEGTLLGDFVDSIEHNQGAMKYLGNVSTISQMNPDASTLDPTSSAAQWARIRVASRYRPLMTEFSTHEMSYKSKPELIIMDTGIDFAHPEFDSPNLEKENFYALPVFNGDFTDELGHGTGVASMAVGVNLGVSQHCKLVSVKVGGMVNGSPYSATLIDVGMAIDAIVARASADPTKTRIVNISWGIARSAWLDAKVQGMIDMGILVVCAAGNSGISVEDISPAGLDTVITVGSIDKYDIPSGFNNISPTDAGVITGTGLSLDLFAPGENVMIASNGVGEFGPNAYALASGTSFACPLVAGVAATIASLHETPVFYSYLKNTIIDTATKNALLFEDDTKFSENQNNVVYLFTADTNSAYKTSGMLSYLGVHESSDPIVADLNSAVTLSPMDKLFPDDPFTFSIQFVDPAVEEIYKPFMKVDPVTGILTIEKPATSLPEETKLKMVEFIAVASSSRAKLESANLFFFDANPAYSDTLSSDVTLALTNVNTISFYAVWSASLK